MMINNDEVRQMADRNATLERVLYLMRTFGDDVLPGLNRRLGNLAGELANASTDAERQRALENACDWLRLVQEDIETAKHLQDEIFRLAS